MITSLKKIKFINKLNVFYKSYLTKRQYQRIVSFYEKKNNCNEKVKSIDVKKVFYFGGDEHQDKSGFLQGLSEVFDVKYFTKEDESYGAYKRSQLCKKLNSQRLEELFEINARDGFIPDMLLMQTWAWRIDIDALKRIKKEYGCIVVNIGMDDRHSYTDHGNWNEGTYGLIPALDLVLTCAPECVEWFKKEGVDALYFPEASHPDFFYPMLEVEKIYDVGFIGAKYGIREEIVNALIDAGINVQCYGNGWEAGRLDLDKTNLFFNQCKIVLGVGTIGHCSDFYALKLRDFDAAMSGAIYLTHNNTDLHDLFNVNEEMFLANNISDFVVQAKTILSFDENKQKTIRDNVYKTALNKHHYTGRFTNVKGYFSR